ncbi:MAG TPA: hypothetical protein EYP10_02345, partial [Armatimonadetes bacterium]|nr:hypothetical protein [Armatimonadota bacterium]
MRINIKCMLACRRARQLLHREQCGEQIAPHLQMWLKEHLEQCRACQRERMLWLAIREALSEVVNQALGTMDAHDERRLLNGIHLRLIRDALVQSHQRRAIASLRWALHGCALGLALLVGFAVGWALHPPKQIVRTIYVPTVRERVVKVPVTV